jgi:NADH dehydrogenase
MLRPHIVILGAGFGGMYVARALVPLVKRGKLDVTIVNQTNYFLFTPLLHEVATGSLSPSSVAEPIREIFAHTGVRIIQGVVESIDRSARIINILCNSDSENVHDRTKHDIHYDFLVIATGATTNYYDIPGADRFTYPLKTLADAAAIRDRIIDSFEEAVLSPDSATRARLLSFAIVGGGATGVETAAEVSDFVKGLVKRYYDDTDCRPDDPCNCSPEEPKVSIIHAGPELLPMFAPSLRQAAEKRLRENGVELHMNRKVTAITPNGLSISGNALSGNAASADTTIPSSTIIWTAGVKPLLSRFMGDMPALAGGRLAIDEHFRLQGDERVFALGDAAAYIDAPLPMLAQVAVGQARIVARNIRAIIEDKPLKSFQYHSKGSMVSVGSWFAIGDIFSMKISGRLTWWLWRTVYLFKFFSWKKRVRIVLQWTLNVFYPRDITKLR